ncbi:MAG TPA: HAD-IG family 5'-nucleotidase [Anaeromyxobacteraceae bacterium]|nr:HAD-IG family 5'-nucleotidase [Anaeromyxobacteraceae bacterium]
MRERLDEQGGRNTENGATLAGPDLQAVLQGPRPGGRDVPGARQVFVNRNLRLDKIDLVGFDMDYTLAIYQLVRLEELAFDLTLQRMVGARGWPERLRQLRYDNAFVIRGLVLDKQAGNIFKMDRHNHVGRAYHGLTPLPKEERYRLYRDEKVALSSTRFAWIDTLFALPEAALYAQVIDAEEAAGHSLDYGRLFRDIRESIDEVHRDGTLKDVVKSDLSRYVVRDPELGPALHKLRSGGKKLFLLTNSLWDYTDAVMRHLLDGVLPEYPSWRNYFDVVVTASAKPGFFSDDAPFLELGPDGQPRPGDVRAFERGKAYAGGNRGELERIVGARGDRILYVGDHIYGDILRSKKSSLWRTCLVVEELEREISWLERHRDEMEEVSRLEELRLRVDDEASARKSGLNVIDRRLERAGDGDPAGPALEAERVRMKRELETLRSGLRDANERIATLQARIEDGYNRYWGLTFKEGNENSRFGEQIEDYACLYTSRASNFVFYSPVQYFRSQRQAMPHERSALRLAPYGEEDPLPAAASRPSSPRAT